MAVNRALHSSDVTISSLGVEQDVVTITDDFVGTFNIDVNPLANGETLQIRIYGKVRSGGTERLLDEYILRHAQHRKFVKSIPIDSVDHCRITLEQTGGSVRTFPCSVYQDDA